MVNSLIVFLIKINLKPFHHLLLGLYKLLNIFKMASNLKIKIFWLIIILPLDKIILPVKFLLMGF